MARYGHKKGRTFNGKVYERAYHFSHKGQAKERARIWRDQGWKVRVVAEVGGFITYRRK